MTPELARIFALFRLCSKTDATCGWLPAARSARTMVEGRVQDGDRSRQRGRKLLRMGRLARYIRARPQRTDCHGQLNDSIYALVDGKLITLCVPYPMGMFAKNVDGRIDDPNAGWKGKACDWRGRIPNCYSRPERSQYRSVRSRMPVLSGKWIVS